MPASLPFVAALLFPAFMAFISVGHHAGLLPCGLGADINVSIHDSPEALTCTLRTMLRESKSLATSDASWRSVDKLWASHKQRSHDLVEVIKEQSAQQSTRRRARKSPAGKKSRASPPASRSFRLRSWSNT